MTEIVWFVFSSSGMVIALLAGVLGLYIRPRSKSPRRYLMAIGVAYALSGTYAVTHSVTRLLAWGFEPFAPQDAPAGRRAIVVLGSGSYLARDWSGAPFPLLDRASAERVVEAARIFRLTDPTLIISSAGVIDPLPYLEPNGRTMRDSLLRLGVPASLVVMETDSRTTREQAVIVGKMLASLPVDHLILVTSAIHMRRALASFRAVGIQPIPAVARDPFHVPSRTNWWFPTEEGFAEGALAAHEVVGLGYYWLRGWARF